MTKCKRRDTCKKKGEDSLDSLGSLVVNNLDVALVCLGPYQLMQIMFIRENVLFL